VPLRSWRVEATGPSPEERVTVRSHPDRGRDATDAFWREGFLVGLPRPGSYRIRVKIPGFAWTERDDVVVGGPMPSGIDHEAVEFLVVPERP
jgi:hypothetical protein